MPRLHDLFIRTWEELELAVACRKRHPHPNPPPGPVAPGSALVTVRFVNHSTTVPDADIAKALVDLQTQVSHDFAPAWLIDAALAFGGALQGGEWVMFIEDDSTVAGALGFHEEMLGVPTGHVFARTCQQFGVSWTSVASHELLEMLGDPRTNMIVSVDADSAGTSAHEYMAEVCDAVEQSVYHVGSTEVSDFVLPAWFDQQAPGPFDHLDLVGGPLVLEPGGSYIATRTIKSTGWTQKTAEKAPAATTETVGSAGATITTSETTTS